MKKKKAGIIGMCLALVFGIVSIFVPQVKQVIEEFDSNYDAIEYIDPYNEDVV